MNLDCPDIEQFFFSKLARLFSKNNFFHVFYIPSLKGFKTLFLNEDKSLNKRLLIQRARKEGVKTIVVQHGFPCHPSGFVPLYADEFWCWKESLDQFLEWGISEESLKVYEPVKPKVLKRILHLEAVLFLKDPCLGKLPPHFYNREMYQELFWTEDEILKICELIKRRANRLVIKCHPRSSKQFKEKISRMYKTSNAEAMDLIYSAERVYSFKYCTTIKDAEIVDNTSLAYVITKKEIKEQPFYKNFHFEQIGEIIQ